ncbi:MAG: hypothetical protein Q9208_004157 [Pyrenodesmia sp. 3 TL-2023]
MTRPILGVADASGRLLYVRHVADRRRRDGKIYALEDKIQVRNGVDVAVVPWSVIDDGAPLDGKAVTLR